MSDETRQDDITIKPVVYQIPGVDAVTIQRDVEYQTTDAGVLTMDLYYPPDWKSGARIPVVVFVSGYPDPGFQKMLGFVNPCAGKTVNDLAKDLPLFIVRAGQDNPQLNETIDRFMAKALSCNLPVTFTNHHAAPHAFDVLHDSETSREIIRQILAFMCFHLLA